MCGIAGILSPKKDISKSVLQKMSDKIAHRGPDGDGFWINKTKNVGFGHRRLAILDLSDDGNQPMHYVDGRYTIVFNGEIYNFLEIRERLAKKGFEFKSECDTEVLLANFHDKGADCVRDFDGMFAFAIWDEAEQKLFCARDRFGEKPFYYTIYDGAFYFASEMKALWEVGIPKQVSEKMLFNFLAHNYLQNPNDLSETFFENIYKLKAAHFFTISPENLEINQRKYWEIDYKNVNHEITETEAAEQFRELFDESVMRRLRSDVAVGSSLSGGLDSSLVVCTIDKLKRGLNIPQATFSARFPGFAKDEGKYMQLVIDRIFVDPHFTFPDENGLVENLERLFYHQEEPFSSASIYAQFCVFGLAKENDVTVLLDGQGADELLAGYHPYFFVYFNELKKRDKLLWKKETAAHQKIHFGGNQFNQKDKLKNSLKYFLPKGIKAKITRTKEKLNLSNLLNKDFIESQFDNYFLTNKIQPKTLAETLFQATFGGELEDLLRYADRNSMAHSREVRLPFLSHKLAEFLFTLPPEFKISGGITKYIMRKAFDDILPSEIINRQDKIGYEPPQNKWLSLPKMQEKMREANSFLVNNSYIRKDFFDKTDSSENISKIWKILIAEMVFKK